MKKDNIEQAIIEIKRYRECNSFSISTESCNLAIEYLEKQIPEQPKYSNSYENADADGNRGIWVSYIKCPNCGYDLSHEDAEVERCPECEQLLDWSEQLKDDDVWNGFWD